MKLTKFELGTIFAAVALLAVMLGWVLGSAPEETSIPVSRAEIELSVGDEPEIAGSNDRLNINTAVSEQLQTLDGIGEELAQRIVDYRAENGPFGSVDDLMSVSGIGDKKLEAIKDKITTGE